MLVHGSLLHTSHRRRYELTLRYFPPEVGFLATVYCPTSTQRGGFVSAGGAQALVDFDSPRRKRGTAEVAASRLPIFRMASVCFLLTSADSD